MEIKTGVLNMDTPNRSHQSHVSEAASDLLKEGKKW